MSKMVTLRLSKQAYDAVRRHAEADRTSMNAWIEALLDAEDMRRRCQAHEQWLQADPQRPAFAEAWSERNLAELQQR